MGKIKHDPFPLAETVSAIAAVSPKLQAMFTDQFGDRIPELTQEKLQQIGLAMTSDGYSATKNEFVETIVNRIGKVVIDNANLTNPLIRFKRGTLEYGEDIEEIFVDIIKAESFESVANIASDPFVLWPHNVDTYFHRINRRDYYPITVRNNQIRTAFLNSSGFNRLIDYLINSLYNSANYDEWILMKQIFAKYLNDPVTPLTPAQIVEVDQPIDEATGKEFYKAIKSALYNLMFASRGYNPAGVMQRQQPQNIEIFVRTDLLPSLEVDVLAAAFNMGQIQPNITITPIDNFGDVNVTPNMAEVYAAIFDQDMIQVWDTWVNDTYNIFNPRGMYANYYHHIWQVYAASYFKNAIFLVSENYASTPPAPLSFKTTHVPENVVISNKLPTE